MSSAVVGHIPVDFYPRISLTPALLKRKTVLVLFPDVNPKVIAPDTGRQFLPLAKQRGNFEGSMSVFRMYEGRPINKLQNGIILLIFKI